MTRRPGVRRVVGLSLGLLRTSSMTSVTTSVMTSLMLTSCGASPRGTEQPGAAAPVERLHQATDEDVDLRGPLTAAAVGDRAVAVAARRGDGRVVMGVAQIRDGQWDGASLRLRPIDTQPALAVALASAAVDEGDGADAGAWLAVSGEEGTKLYRVDVSGDLGLAAELRTTAASEVDLAVSADGVLVGARTADGSASLFLVRHGEPLALGFAPEQGVLRLAVGFVGGAPVVAFASGAGVQVRSRRGAVVLSDEPAREVALATLAEGVAVAWTDDLGVHAVRVAAGPTAQAPVTVDDGSRHGEPAHRVGAALALLEDGSRIIAAYQDQTDGALVLAREGAAGFERQPVLSPHHTRAMHAAMVRAGDTAVLLDLAARSAGPRARMSPLVTLLPR